MQTIATTIDVGCSDGPAGMTGGVGRALAGAHFLMEVEARTLAATHAADARPTTSALSAK